MDQFRYSGVVNDLYTTHHLTVWYNLLSILREKNIGKEEREKLRMSFIHFRPRNWRFDLQLLAPIYNHDRFPSRPTSDLGTHKTFYIGGMVGERRMGDWKVNEMVDNKNRRQWTSSQSFFGELMVLNVTLLLLHTNFFPEFSQSFNKNKVLKVSS